MVLKEEVGKALGRVGRGCWHSSHVGVSPGHTFN